MWCSDRRGFFALALAAPAVLAACGFSPALAPGAPAAALRGRVRAEDPADARARAFVARIEERLGPPEAADFRLAYALETRRRPVGITPGGLTTRVQIEGLARFTLIAAATGAELLSGRVEGFTAYSTTGSAVAALAAAEAAEARLMRILADQVVGRLLAWPGAG